MDIFFRHANKEDDAELTFIAEQDSKIPTLYDPDFPWDQSTVTARKELFKNQISKEDFFTVGLIDAKIIGFHIVKKIPYGGVFAGLIITLWTDENYRGKGIAKALKEQAEAWGRNLSLDHLQTGVHSSNKRMLEINKKSEFEITQYNLKKKL